MSENDLDELNRLFGIYHIERTQEAYRHLYDYCLQLSKPMISKQQILSHQYGTLAEDAYIEALETKVMKLVDDPDIDPAGFAYIFVTAVKNIFRSVSRSLGFHSHSLPKNFTDIKVDDSKMLETLCSHTPPPLDPPAERFSGTMMRQFFKLNSGCLAGFVQKSYGDLEGNDAARLALQGDIPIHQLRRHHRTICDRLKETKYRSEAFDKRGKPDASFVHYLLATAQNVLEEEGLTRS